MMKSSSILCIKLFLIHVLFLTCIVLDIYFKDELFTDSLSYTISIQKNSNKTLDIIFLFFCNLVNPVTVSLLSIIYYSFSKKKIQALVFLIAQILISYMNSLIKMAYHDPRPYWVNSQIVAKECYLEYGNPSGHSLMATFIIGTLWYEIYLRVHATKNETKKEGNEYERLFLENSQHICENVETKETVPSMKQKILMISITVFFALVFGMICFGRIYVGMHSYDQVLLGIVYGLYFLLLYYMIFKRFCTAAIFFILKRNLKARQKNETCSFAVMFKIFLIYTIFLSIPLCCLEIYKSQSTDIHPLWRQNIDNSCRFGSKLEAFTEKCYLDTGIIGFAFGVLFGLTMPVGDYNPNLFLGSFDTTLISTEPSFNFKKGVARALITVLGCFLWVGVFYFIPHDHSIFCFYFINIGLSSLVAGISLVLFVQFVIHKCRLENNEDIIHFGKIIY